MFKTFKSVLVILFFITSTFSIFLVSFPLLTHIYELASDNAEKLAIVKESIIGLIFSIVMIWAIIVVQGIWLASNLVRPIQALKRMAREYAKGNYDFSPPELKYIEFKEFANTLFEMGRTIVSQIKESAIRERLKQELERNKLESELFTLRNQMKPHFLFNTLNSISVMVSVDQDAASLMINKLSNLYRHITTASKNTTSPLELEIQIVKNYLDIQKMRFEERLKYNISVSDSATTIFLPGLVLQTLVENAVKHGIEKSRKGGVIDISIKRITDERVEISIFNNGGEYSPDNRRKKDHTGTGLENTIKRLALLYGNDCGFSIGKAENSEYGIGTNVSFCVSGKEVNKEDE